MTSKKVDVIVAFGYPSALAAKERTTLPVVSFTTGDPVGTGLVDGLARPGGHVTGISDVSAKITPKRLGLLKEMAPALRRVAMLWNAADPGMTMRYRAAEAGAKTRGIIVQPLPVREPKEFDQAFAAMNKHMPDAILMVHDALASLNRKRVFEFVAAHRLPAIYEDDLYVRDGGLMSYGPDSNESLARGRPRRSHPQRGEARGASFEQPTVFRFVLNLKTAKSLGLTVPLTLRTSADEVIE